MPAEPLSAASA